MEQNKIRVEINGVTHSGSYTVASGIVTATYGVYQKATQVGGSPAQVIARTLLRELVRETGGNPI